MRHNQKNAWQWQAILHAGSICKCGGAGPLLNHCIVSPSVMTEILYEKYFKGAPLNRQEKMWRDLGIIITHKDMAYWTNRVCEEWLQLLVRYLYQMMLAENEVIHSDETRIQCNPGGSPYQAVCNP